MAKLEFGILDGYSELELGGTGAAEVYDHHIRAAQAAERLGYRYYFFIEHQNAEFTTVTAPSVYLAALARETSRLRFGPMVYQLPLYHPVRLAQDAAMVDQLSHGRLEFAIGYGTRLGEFAPWKANFAERRQMGLEAMEIILKAWTEDTLTYEGKYWSFERALPKPKPYQEPHPPVWIGAHSAASFDYAADHNFHVAQNIDLDNTVAEKFAYWREAWAQRKHPGPRPRQLLARHVHVADTDERARAEAEPLLLRGMNGPIPVRTAQERTAHLSEIGLIYEQCTQSYDYWIDNGLAIVGSPDTVIKRLEEQQRFVGYDVFCGQHEIAGMPLEQTQRSLQLFGEEVIPAFA